MQPRASKWRTTLPVIGTLLLWCCCAPVSAADSLIMPLASQSLLLDVCNAGSRLVAVGERGHILLSDDAGQQWRQARVPTRQMLTAVYFPSPRRGWAVGHDGLVLVSVDGGESWAIQRNGLAEQLRLNQQRLSAVEQQIAANKQSLLEADNARRREQLQQQLEELALDREDLQYLLAGPVHAPPLLDLYFFDELRGIVVGAFNSLLITRDGGVTWLEVSERLHNPDELHLNAVTGGDDGHAWIAAEGGLLFRSSDQGASWSSLPSPYAASWFGIARDPRSKTLLAFGLRGNIYRSTDGGKNWLASASNAERSLSGGVFVNEQYVVLAGAVGSLLLSKDGGRSFSSHPLKQRVNLSSVTAHSGKIIAVGQGGIYRRDSLEQLQ
ncbi:MAG: YCF48-related protein [Halieaceae bacterium]